jgi:hypothetical protein
MTAMLRDIKESFEKDIIPIPDPHLKTCINFYQHILFPGEFGVICNNNT